LEPVILGGMGRELESEMLQRLQSHYGEMSDGELLATKPGGLDRPGGGGAAWEMASEG